MHRPVLAGMPLHVHPAAALFRQLLERVAVDRMHHHALAAIGNADDALARHRLAALRELEALARIEAHDGALGVDLAAFLGGRVERGHHVARGKLGRTKLGQKLTGGAEAKLFRRRLQRLVGGAPANMLERHPRQLAAELDEALAVFLAQPAADRALGPPGHHDIEPGSLRALPLGGDDLDRLAVLDPGPERHADTVDLGADAGIADPGMDRISEIERRGAARQFHHLAFGGEAEHLVGIHLELHVLEEVVVILGVLEPLGQRREPLGGINGKRVFGTHAVAVAPMRRHPGLGHLVHLAGADLHLDALAVPP